MTGNDHLRFSVRGIGRCAVLMTVSVTAAIGPVSSEAADGPLPIDESAERAFLKELGEGYLVTRSCSSVLYHDIDEAKARDILLWMDRVVPRVERFCATYDLASTPITRRLEAVYSKEIGALHQLNVPGMWYVAGVYDRVSKRCYFGFSDRFKSCLGFSEVAMSEIRRVSVRHETSHQALDHLCPILSANMPEWLAEGLACAFERGSVESNDASMKINRERASDAVQTKLSLLEVMTRSGGPQATNVEGPAVAVYQAQWYAASWAAVFYLQNEKPAEFRRLLHALNTPTYSPVQLQETLKKTLGPIDKEFENRVLQYLRTAYGR